MDNDPLSPFIKALHDLINNAEPRQVSSMDQYRSTSAERARELLAYYVLTCLNQEADQFNEATRYAIKFSLRIKALSPFDYMGVVTALVELIAEFLLAQGDGTYKDVVRRLLDPDIPLIPGRDETLRELDKQFHTEGPSMG